MHEYSNVLLCLALIHEYVLKHNDSAMPSASTMLSAMLETFPFMCLSGYLMTF